MKYLMNNLNIKYFQEYLLEHEVFFFFLTLWAYIVIFNNINFDIKTYGFEGFKGKMRLEIGKSEEKWPWDLESYVAAEFVNIHQNRQTLIFRGFL